MKQHTDPSVIRNMEQVRKLEKKYPERDWSYNMTREQIIKYGPDILKGDRDKLNEILKEKGFEPIEKK